MFKAKQNKNIEKKQQQKQTICDRSKKNTFWTSAQTKLKTQIDQLNTKKNKNSVCAWLADLWLETKTHTHTFKAANPEIYRKIYKTKRQHFNTSKNRLKQATIQKKNRITPNKQKNALNKNNSN